MHHFDYRAGVLHAEAVNVEDMAAAVGTPFYCYATATLERHYQVFAGAFADVPALVCYAMKANSNQAVIKTFAKLGVGADVVSEGELKRARAAGILTMLHCENGDVIDVLIRQALAAGKTEPRYHALSRPQQLEGEATGRERAW